MNIVTSKSNKVDPMSGMQIFEQQVVREFAESLRAEAEERLSELDVGSPLAREAALADVILNRLEEAGAVTAHDLCPHEDLGGRRLCRVIAYSLSEDSTRLELFTAYACTAGDREVLPKNEVARLTGWAARFFEYAAKQDFGRFEENKTALEVAKRISEELDRIQDVRIHLLTDGSVRDREVEGIEVLNRPVEFEVWDVERLYRASGEEVTRDRIEVDFQAMMGRPIACLEMQPPPKDYQTFLVILSGDTVFQLYERYGAQLFEFNVRSFLQVKGKVNAGLRKTIELSPERFLAYNNGLTATADYIEAGQWHGETVIFKLRGLQIVNGAQTTASIHRAKKSDKLDISRIAVAMKLTLVDSKQLSEFVPKIAEYANTQNPIQMADLQASHRFHQRMEDLSQSVWCPGEGTRWFFERARGSYQVARNRYGTSAAKKLEFDETCPKSQHFGKPELAKYLMSWWGYPDSVSRGAQKNHDKFLVTLVDRMGADWEPDREFYKDTIAKALLFKAAQSAVRKCKLGAYGANVVTYMVAKFAASYGGGLDLDLLWDNQEVSEELSSLFIEWAPHIHGAIVESAGSRNVTEWCKKPACWEVIQSVRLPTPKKTPPEFESEARDDADDSAAGEFDGGPTEADEIIRRCMSLDGEAWGKVIAWAASAKSVEDFDRKVAHTISGYAMDGWKRRPSEKQAIRGNRVIEMAKRAGI